MTVKPHLFSLLAAVLAWWILRNRAYSLLFSFAAFLSALLFSTLYLAPQVYAHWAASITGKIPGNYIRVTEWRTASLVEILRDLFARPNDSLPWLIPVVPCAAALLTLSYFAAKKREIDWKADFPPLILLSVWTSPFAWLFDYSVLSILHAAAVAKQLPRAWPAIIAVQLIAFGSYATWAHAHHHFWWYPLLVLLAWLALHPHNSRTDHLTP
jgi:hypothetical protein